MEERKIRVAITHGDTNGIGYEVILKTFADPTMLELCTPIVYGSPKVAAYHSKTLGIDTPFSVINHANEAREARLNMLTAVDDDVKVDLGVSTPESGMAAKMAIDRALADYQKGLFDVLVTAPVSKNSIPNFNGHTDYIEKTLADGQKGLTILTNDVSLCGSLTVVPDCSDSTSYLTASLLGIINVTLIDAHKVSKDVEVIDVVIATINVWETVNLATTGTPHLCHVYIG